MAFSLSSENEYLTFVILFYSTYSVSVLLVCEVCFTYWYLPIAEKQKLAHSKTKTIMNRVFCIFKLISQQKTIVFLTSVISDLLVFILAI